MRPALGAGRQGRGRAGEAEGGPPGRAKERGGEKKEEERERGKRTSRRDTAEVQ